MNQINHYLLIYLSTFVKCYNTARSAASVQSLMIFDKQPQYARTNTEHLLHCCNMTGKLYNISTIFMFFILNINI